jgi:intracellular septation protein A
MLILLSMLPWLVFWFVKGSSFTVAVWVAFGLGLAVNLRRYVNRQLKTIDIFSAIFFAIVAFLSIFIHSDWFEDWSFYIGSSALILVLVATILARKPFTIQYALERYPDEYLCLPKFYSTNVVVSWAWCAAIAVMVASALPSTIWPDSGDWLHWTIRTIALVAVVVFTRLYVRRELGVSRPGSIAGP